MKKTILKISLVTVMLAVTSSANSVKAINAKYDHLIKIARDAGFAYGKTAQQRVDIFNKKRDTEISELRNRLAKSSKIKSLNKQVGSAKNKLHRTESINNKLHQDLTSLKAQNNALKNDSIRKVKSLDLTNTSKKELLAFTEKCIKSPVTKLKTEGHEMICYQDKNELINYLSANQAKTENLTLVKQTLTK